MGKETLPVNRDAMSEVNPLGVQVSHFNMNEDDETALARKLAEKWHLNVPERRSLPSSGIAASALVAAVGEILAETSSYPRNWSPDEPVYDGIVIAPTQDGFKLHERHEIGACRFSPATITEVATLEEAVRRFLQATYKVDDIDGVRIDWHR